MTTNKHIKLMTIMTIIILIAILTFVFDLSLKENDFLKLSSKAYDEGFEDEAQKLATTLRILLHDTNKSKLLFSYLNITQNVYFISSVAYLIPANLIAYIVL